MYWELAGNKVVTGMTAFLGTTNAQPLRIRTNAGPSMPGQNVDKMIITTDGNVGIGTASLPSSRFQLKSLTAIDEGATAAGAWANFGSNAFFDGAWKRIDQTRAGVNLHINPDGAGQEFRFLRVEADGSRLRNLAVIGSTTSFIAEGNVGIGTTAPGAKLDISRSGGANQCCAPPGIIPTLSLAERSKTGSIPVSQPNTQAWLQFHNAGEAEMYIRLAGGGDPGSGREGQRRLEIGTSQPVIPSLRVNGDLDVTGDARKPGGGSWSGTSDVRLKKNVKPLKGALSKLLQLRGMRFEWKEPEKQGNLVGPQMGLVAQEVEGVFPEWVDTDPSGYKILSVRGFEALTVEAFRELKAENEALKMKNEELEDRTKILEPTIPERQPSGNRNGAVR